MLQSSYREREYGLGGLNLPSWPANDIDVWLPDRWKKAQAAGCEALEIPPLDS
jgi:hypothetical protein